MRIVFDCRYTRIGRHDGISRYTARLVEALAALHPVTMLISDHRQLDLLPALPWELVSSPTSAREPLVALQVNRLRPDVVFSPMQTMGSWGRRYRLILTVHDLIYYRHRTPPPELGWPIRLLWRLYHLAWWPQRLLLNRADAVVVVSDTTGSLLAEHDLTRRPVTVVPNAAEAPLGPEPRTRNRADARSLVYMGSFMPYKNVGTLARALHDLPGYVLHLMSRASESERMSLEAMAPPDSLVFHQGASDGEYHRVLGQATALVTASRDEGFGIPLVEAMAQGTPVAVSDIPIFREIGGDAAVFFDQENPASVAAAIRSVAEPERWQARSEAALVQASLFTWQRSAAQLFEVIRQTAEN